MPLLAHFTRLSGAVCVLAKGYFPPSKKWKIYLACFVWLLHTNDCIL